MALRKTDGLYIDAEWVEPIGEKSDSIMNPATEEIIGHAPVGTAREVVWAIEAARRAFDSGPWPRMTSAARAEKLQALHDAIMHRADEIKTLIVAEAGATLALGSALHFGVAMKHFRYFIEAGKANSMRPTQPELTPNAAGGISLGIGVTLRQPVGVVAAITPYNFPFMLNISKLIPALAAGNTIVLKPSPYTPFEALILGELIHEVGFPRGTVNIVTGGPEAGQLLTTDRRIDLVTFTGSDMVGAAIAGQSAPSLKRLLLELGGKSALIVRADADIDAAAAAGLAGFTTHCGQGCALVTRHLVHNSVRPRYVATLAAMASKIKVGDPMDPATTMGPLIREAQRARVERYVQIARDGGAKLVHGGRRPKDSERGFFFEPTLFDEVDNRSTIAQEEVFGPIGVVIGFDTDEQAVAAANDSEFGLSGAIFSRNTGRAFEMALQMRTGVVNLNGGPGTMLSDSPFGGIKRSGWGREYGPEALHEYTFVKSINFRAV